MYVEEQAVALNAPLIFRNSIPCNRGNVYHANETGIFTLRGATQNCFARYELEFVGNVALPEGGTPGPVAIAFTLNGETIPASLSIDTLAAVEEYENITSIATVDVPRGCCFSVAVRHVDADADPTTTPAPVLNVQNATLRIKRTA